MDLCIRGVAQPGSVLVSVTRGRRFEPDLPDQISHGVLEVVDNVADKPMRDGTIVSWFMAKTDGADEPDRSAYEGSIPSVMRNLLRAGIAQLVRAPVCGTGCRKFKSSCPCQSSVDRGLRLPRSIIM